MDRRINKEFLDSATVSNLIKAILPDLFVNPGLLVHYNFSEYRQVKRIWCEEHCRRKLFFARLPDMLHSAQKVKNVPQ